MEPAAIEVVCGSTRGTLNLTKFCAGGPKGGRHPACILTGDCWRTPTAFEKFAGKAQCKSWKRTIKVNGVPMYTLMEQGYFMQHSAGCRCVICSAGEDSEEPMYNKSIKPFPPSGIPLIYDGKAATNKPTKQEFLPTMCKAAGSNHFKSDPAKKQQETPSHIKSEPDTPESYLTSFTKYLTPPASLDDIPTLPNDSLEDYIEGLEESGEGPEGRTFAEIDREMEEENRMLGGRMEAGEWEEASNGTCVKRRMSIESSERASSSKRSKLRTPSHSYNDLTINLQGLSPVSTHNERKNSRSVTLSPVRNASNHALSSLTEQYTNLSTISQSLPNSDEFFKKYAEVMKISSKVLEQTNFIHERIDLMSVTVSNLHDDLLNITQTIEMSHLTRLLEDNSDRGLQPSDLRALINLLTKFTLKFKTAESPLKTPSKSVRDDVPELVTLEGYRLCMNCNRNSKYVCAQCSRSFYCSKFCQTRGWFTHSSECGIG